MLFSATLDTPDRFLVGFLVSPGDAVRVYGLYQVGPFALVRSFGQQFNGGHWQVKHVVNAVSCAN
jgi:hypothetical protein